MNSHGAVLRDGMLAALDQLSHPLKESTSGMITRWTIWPAACPLGILWVATLFWTIPPADAQPVDPRFETPEQAVHFAFARYRNAVLVRDGETAYATVDARTRAYYDRVIDLVKYGSQEELREHTFTDLTIILSSRQFIPRDSLAGMDGRALFVHAVSSGWTDREIVVAGLGPIEFRDDTAIAVATRSGIHTLFHWVFRFEEERWHLDLTEQMRGIDEASRQMLAAEGLEPADLAFAMLVRGAGADVVSEEIWEPPFTR